MDLASRRPQPHASGKARCTACGHVWVAVKPVPEETPWMECPECGSHRGLYVHYFGLPEGSQMWRCHCGNELFFVTPDGMYCPGCALWQRF